jgi:hypothetical protein
MKNKERIQILESEISRLKVANRNNIYRIEAIESHLAEEHKGANFSKLNSSEIPNTCEAVTPDFIPDWKDAPEWATCKAMDKSGIWNWYSSQPYIEDGMNEWCLKSANDKYKLIPNHPPSDKIWIETLEMRPESISDAPDYAHLLPDGYEFCQEADAEKWVKVEMLDVNDNDEYPIGHIDNFTCFKGRWRPIRPIQYKVTTHEIVTAVPDPYQPDWSKAPEGTVAHAWDMDGRGFWIYIDYHDGKHRFDLNELALTLPADLDWRQSLRVKPN